ncbi:hypothetical protein GCM10009792_08150 [Microcella alkalica]|uniref:Uncharacterized protein n=1 Tax=Microcella alkalica TaxID=355930 RepID=A0A839EB38_9MICO|nr:hypothetical protein [Microcella alkalica]MBA8846555.1 hypothetical protein [Microcella alkalica]
MLTDPRASHAPSSAAASGSDGRAMTRPDIAPGWRLDLPRQHWHRPLLGLAIALAALTFVALVGFVVDDRELLGRPLWEKPLKFAISGSIYALTWSWLLGHVLAPRGRRIAWWAGTVITVTLAIELVVIVGFAAVGLRSHFMVDTPLAVTAWSIMAGAITTLWVATIVAGLAMWSLPGADPARRAALRAGILISLVGLALGFLMTGSTSGQLADFQGVAGAHTVGLPDGGSGLPLVGWSTEAGDLRIPHFIGMHALQALPLLALLLELAARRIGALRASSIRRRLVLVGAGAFAAVVAIVTQQALRGQSIVAPDALTLSFAAVVAVLVAVAAIAVLAVARRPTRSPGARPDSRALRH